MHLFHTKGVAGTIDGGNIVRVVYIGEYECQIGLTVCQHLGEACPAACGGFCHGGFLVSCSLTCFVIAEKRLQGKRGTGNVTKEEPHPRVGRDATFVSSCEKVFFLGKDCPVTVSTGKNSHWHPLIS